MNLGSRLLIIRARLVIRRAARHRRRALERELADYATPAQRLDLEATLDRYPDGVTFELRDILARRAMAADAPAWPAARLR
ncbi:MAG TPA: hypothetical protein VHN80_01750 [Kineosporiaceae bacterium]|jgi:hypothetical protein|nr:hypothetical protein [Kineosporiaceae bacterium]